MGDRLKLIGMHVARYGLVIVLLWIGGMKFTAYEAEGIKPLVANSPLMSWVYRVMSVGGFSSLLGVVEIAIAHRTPTGVASGISRGQRARDGDVSDHAELPGHHARLGAEPGRLPALSAMPGQFVLKDVVLLGVALFSAGEALEAARPHSAGEAAASQDAIS